MSYQFYRWFPGDYMMDTMHLSVTEDCMYRRLIDLYNITGKPIRNDRDYIMKAVRAREPEHYGAVDNVLAEFFILKIDGWHQLRCDAEVRYRKGFSEHGRRGAKARWNAQSGTLHSTPPTKPIPLRGFHAGALRGQCEQEQEQEVLPLVVPEVPGRDVPSITHKSKVAKATFELPDWIPKEPWDAYLEMRKKLKKPATEWAMKLAVMKLKNLQERGEEATQVLMQSAFKGWTDLYPVGGTR